MHEVECCHVFLILYALFRSQYLFVMKLQPQSILQNWCSCAPLPSVSAMDDLRLCIRLLILRVGGR